jgi:asparagine synthase (glutamine-hydrolysing)
MCGIAGYWQLGVPLETDVLHRMAAAISHRGPDDEGTWLDQSAGIALAHRRLSILDLSPAGSQPMVSASGRYVIVFNGEIYNHLNIRHDLQCPFWRGHSDTETLLAAFERWGIEGALKKSVGMFALALWDRETQTLTLARDRLGEKPLYYGWQNGTFLFGSELKALKAHPAFTGTVDRDALTLFLRHSAIPSPYSIYKGIHKLPPGMYWQKSLMHERFSTCDRGELKTYWSAREVTEQGQRNPFGGTDSEALDTLELVLGQSIEGQMLADVPLGAFLSGGVDSSTVVALMQARSKRPVKTFTIGFHQAGYNEAEHALAVARNLGTDHTELYVNPDEIRAVIPLLPTLYDEPFSDSSQIPTYLVSQLARTQVTVSLSGDGGDELFGGYNRYIWVQRVWRRLGWLPNSMRAALAGVLTTLPPTSWDSAFSRLDRMLPTKFRYKNPGDKLHKLADVLAVHSPEEIYWGLVSHWKQPGQIVKGATEPTTVLTDASKWAQVPDLTHRMMYLDSVTYLSDDVLTKVDRAAMGVSLETRVPMLDHRVFEFAWTLPLNMKLRNGQSKWLLRQLLYRHVPKEIIERPKMGFGIPLDTWLRGPLKAWAEDLLNPARLEAEGYFYSEPIQQKWREHQAGQRNWSYELWDVLMFQAWRVQNAL